MTDWQTLPVTLTDRELLIGGKQVMQAWEQPLMRRMADEVLNALKGKDAKFLEVGYGMGILTKCLWDNNSPLSKFSTIRSYDIIEAHPEIANNARREFGDLATIHQGFWQDITPTMPAESFDAIFFDTYPTKPGGSDANPCEMIPPMARLLRPGGLLTWYSGSKRNFPHDQLLCLFDHFDEVRLIKMAGLEPYEGCEYWNGSEMIIPVARKGR